MLLTPSPELTVHLRDVALATTCAAVERGEVDVRAATCVVPRATLEAAAAHWGEPYQLRVEPPGAEPGRLVVVGRHGLGFRAELELVRAAGGLLDVVLADATPTGRVPRAGHSVLRGLYGLAGRDFDDAVRDLLRERVVPDVPGFAAGRGRTILAVDVRVTLRELAGLSVPGVREVLVDSTGVRIELGE